MAEDKVWVVNYAIGDGEDSERGVWAICTSEAEAERCERLYTLTQREGRAWIDGEITLNKPHY